MTLPVAILAGGLATRLRPLTERIPKALVPVAGKPFVEWQLDYLSTQGIERVVICAGYLGDEIVRQIGDGGRFGLKVEYSFDGDQPLGTAGAILRALPRLGEVFFVLYGDSFLPVSFARVEAAFKGSAFAGLMTVLHNENRWDRSNVNFRNGRLLEYNKSSPSAEMEYIDYGLSILTANAMVVHHTDLPADLSNVFRAMSLRGELGGLEVQERFYEIGTFGGLEEAERYFKEGSQ